jgi:hypothetical protein
LNGARRRGRRETQPHAPQGAHPDASTSRGRLGTRGRERCRPRAPAAAAPGTTTATACRHRSSKPTSHRREPGVPGLNPVPFDHLFIRGREAWPHRASRTRDPAGGEGDAPPCGRVPRHPRRSGGPARDRPVGGAQVPPHRFRPRPTTSRVVGPPQLRVTRQGRVTRANAASGNPERPGESC